MTEIDTEQVRRSHIRDHGDCLGCGFTWPCPTVRLCDALDACRKERDDAIAGQVMLDDKLTLMEHRALDAEAEVARLREALERYARHDPTCAFTVDVVGGYDQPRPCSCGVAAALAPAPKDQSNNERTNP